MKDHATSGMRKEKTIRLFNKTKIYIPICIIYINIIYIYNLHIIIDNYSRYGMYMNVYPYSRFFPWTFVSILGLFPFPPGPLT